MFKNTAMQVFLRLVPFFFLCLLLSARAQDRYFTKTGKISFYSHAPLENIEAVNKTAGAVLDASSGALQVAVLMKGFEFKKALMQEHFNENYVESHKYPKAEFRGNIVNNNDLNYSRDGSYAVRVKGQLTLHGITREMEAPVLLRIQGGKIDATATFTIQVADYGIRIPALMKDKISEQVKVTVDTKLEPLP